MRRGDTAKPARLRSSDQPAGHKLHGALLVAAAQLDAGPLAGCAQARADRFQPERARQPGNVRLRKGEAGLPKASVVNITQIATLDRASLSAKIGRLSRHRLAEIWQGVCLVLAPG